VNLLAPLRCGLRHVAQMHDAERHMARFVLGTEPVDRYASDVAWPGPVWSAGIVEGVDLSGRSETVPWFLRRVLGF